MGFGVWGLGFGVWGLGFGVWGLGFGVWGLGFRAINLGMRSGLVDGASGAQKKDLRSHRACALFEAGCLEVVFFVCLLFLLCFLFFRGLGVIA